MQRNSEAPIISQGQHSPQQPIDEQNLDLRYKKNEREEFQTRQTKIANSNNFILRYCIDQNITL